MHPAVAVYLHADLRLIFIPFPQTGRFQDAAEHHLAPVTLRFIVAFQGLGQVDGFTRHLHIQLLQITDFVRQRMPLTGLLS
ncbi:hypothetical protein D3C80_2129620 [compost metagenome]